MHLIKGTLKSYIRMQFKMWLGDQILDTYSKMAGFLILSCSIQKDTSFFT